jgi:hypothetical protein
VPGSPELCRPFMVLSGLLLLLCVSRASVLLDRRYKPVYWAYMFGLCMTAAYAAYVPRERAASPLFQLDIARFMAVRNHFFEVNGMKWSKGLAFPYGFKMPKALLQKR